MTSSSPTSSDGPIDSAPDSDDPAKLQGAQQRLAAAYFDAESGLFALNCVPGAGKSLVRSDLAARELLRRWERGDRTPEQQVCVLTFNRGEADSIVSDIAERVRAHIEHDLSPAGAELSPADGESLIRQVRQAPYIGTIDGLLRSVLGDILGDVGFDELPAIGHDAHLEHLHRNCFQALRYGWSPEADLPSACQC
jgi:ATP-dependent helicase/nuclease subunit A